jgi:hypothetical protein
LQRILSKFSSFRNFFGFLKLKWAIEEVFAVDSVAVVVEAAAKVVEAAAVIEVVAADVADVADEVEVEDVAAAVVEEKTVKKNGYPLRNWAV